jgi:hypothetical protein
MLDKDERENVRVAVELRLTAHCNYGIWHLDLGFGLYDESTGKCVTTYDLPFGDNLPDLYEVGITAHVWDYQPPRCIWGSNVQLHKYNPTVYDVKKYLPLMKRLDKALSDHRDETGDDSYAGAIVALAKATKARRLNYREDRRDRIIERRDIPAEAVRIVDAYVAKHGRNAA